MCVCVGDKYKINKQINFIDDINQYCQRLDYAAFSKRYDFIYMVYELIV